VLLPAVLLAAASASTTLVVPPEGPGSGGELAWVAEAVADELSRALQQLDVPAIDRADRLRAQEALEIPRVPLTRATSIRIAQALGADRLVIGTFDSEGAALSLALRVLDVERGTLSAPLMASAPLENLAALIEGLAWDLALSGPSPPTITREAYRARRPPVPFPALKAYAQGLGAGDAAARMKLIRHALRIDPGYEAARLALASLQLQARELEPALETLARIPQRSPLARAAGFLRGVALFELGRYREASTLYDGLARERATAAVLNNYALALLRLGSTAPRSSAILRQAVELEPDSGDLAFNLGWALLTEGEAGASAFWLQGVARDAPTDIHARVVHSWALRLAGRAQEADGEWQAVAALAPAYESLVAPDLGRRFERIQVSERLLAASGEPRSDAQVAGDLVVAAERQAAAGTRRPRCACSRAPSTSIRTTTARTCCSREPIARWGSARRRPPSCAWRSGRRRTRTCAPSSPFCCSSSGAPPRRAPRPRRRCSRTPATPPRGACSSGRSGPPAVLSRREAGRRERTGRGRRDGSL
jgi:tetratricopeptide (TPR) repeat protein